MSFNFAIIGGGLTGTTMFYQIVEKIQQGIDLCKFNPSKIKVKIFEKQESFGPGFPHCDRNVMPYHQTMVPKNGGFNLPLP